MYHKNHLATVKAEYLPFIFLYISLYCNKMR
nr:MAG TPA: hypothetical protein [Caudoviricetes sp.]